MTTHIFTSSEIFINKSPTTTPSPLIYDNFQLQQETHREFLLFPTYAKRNPHDNSQWIVKAKGWALSHNSSSAKQKMMMGITKSVAGKYSVDSDANMMFQERFKYFLANNKKHKEFLIQAIGMITSQETRQQQKREEFWNMLSSTSTHMTETTRQSPQLEYMMFHPPFPITPPDEEENDDKDSFFEQQQHTSIILSRPHNPISSVLDKRNDFSDNYCYKRSSSLGSLSSTTINTTTTTTSPTEEGSVHLKTKGSGFLSGQFFLSHDTILAWASEQNQCDTRLIQLESTSNCGKFIPNQNIVNLIDTIGISVISDIDDTIKDTQIRQGARTMLSKTFFEPPQGVSGMADVYTSWYSQGAAFHYVSNSPFQLMPMLDKFIKDASFPPGSIHLRDKLISRLVETPGQAKRDTILGILKDFPHRKFILVGDSGEIDLEIYTRIAIEFPHQILKVYIRDVTTPHANNLIKTSDTTVKERRRRSSLLFAKRRSHSASEFTTIPTNLQHRDKKEEMKKFRSTIRSAATTLFTTEYAVEFTGHRSSSKILDDDNSGLEDQQNVSIREAYTQLYHRIAKAQRQLHPFSIDIILFQHADTLQNDLEIRDALWDMLDSSLLHEEESSAPP